MVLSFENFNQANFRTLVFYCDFIKIQGHNYYCIKNKIMQRQDRKKNYSNITK